MTAEPGRVLVVDDVESNRELLGRRLHRQGYQVFMAENGLKALEFVIDQPVDVILLDVMMPHMDGYEVLDRLKSDPNLRNIPVVMISALNDIDSVVRCIERGAEDYLFKPFNPTLLQARIRACMEKKRLHDQEQAFLEQLQAEQEKSERLLLNILPQAIAERLKQGDNTIADTFTEVTVLFADIVGFTKLAADISASELVELLNEIFSKFDSLAEHHGLEKIKTIGDAYMVVGGLPVPTANHAEAIAEMALDIQSAIQQVYAKNGEPFRMRIGIHTGPVIAGVIGRKKFTYDLWGDTVNTASRMEYHGIAGEIQVSEATYQLLQDKYIFQERGTIQVKDKGEMQTYLLMDRKSS